MEGSESKTSPPKAPLSPPGSPPKAHESIWKRSKKILGMSRFAFLQQIDAQGPRDKTSPGGSDGANGKPAVSKRREQVRRAQKTHRQRTENYIKALEQEVLRLQKEEADRAWERQNKQHSDAYVKALEKQVVELQKETALIHRGSTEPQFSPAATLTLYDQNGEWALKAEMPQYPQQPAFVSPSQISSPSFGGSDAGYGQVYSSHWHNLMLINPLANHQTAIDFVLSIEAECMTHLHAHIIKPGAINGHALTASACLIETAPLTTTTTTTTSTSFTSPPATWTTSHAEIERLFQLASNLGLEGEITPVEAWNRIWQHPLAGGLTVGGLQALEGGLKRIVCCYGFGGAINEKDFCVVLDNAIAQG